MTLVTAVAKDDPPIKTKSGNAFINMSKKLLSSTPSQVEALNPGLFNLGNSCYFNSTLQGVGNLM
jgi:ubiquitin C-terminal hydrolase